MNSYWHFYNYWSLLLFMKIIVKAHLAHQPAGRLDETTKTMDPVFQHVIE